MEYVGKHIQEMFECMMKEALDAFTAYGDKLIESEENINPSKVVSNSTLLRLALSMVTQLYQALRNGGETENLPFEVLYYYIIRVLIVKCGLLVHFTALSALKR